VEFTILFWKFSGEYSSFVIMQAEMKFHDLSAMWKEGGVCPVDTPRGAVCKPVIPPTSFEVCCDFPVFQYLIENM